MRTCAAAMQARRDALGGRGTTTMTLCKPLVFGALAALAAGLAGCAQPVVVTPPPVVATLPPAPPVMPYGGYSGLKIPDKRNDGTYITPNFDMTDAAAVWHLRAALNVAALACDNAGGGVLDGYNAWLAAHRPVLDAAVKQYLHEWEVTGWSDWEQAYETNQTRIYNFYSQSTIRVAFCAAARTEIANIGTVTDADLPKYARAALVRIDKPFIDFYTAFDAWRDYYEPHVTPPPVIATLPETPVPAAPPVAMARATPDIAAPTSTLQTPDIPPAAVTTVAVPAPPAEPAPAPVGESQPTTETATPDTSK
jgi:hypothetical protein